MKIAAAIVVVALVMALAALEVFASRALDDLELSGAHAREFWAR